MDIRVFNVVSIKFIDEKGVAYTDQTNVTRDALIKLTFNTDIDRSNISNKISVSESKTGIKVSGVILFDNTRTLIFKPSLPFHGGVSYIVSTINDPSSPFKSILGIACTPYSYIFNVKVDVLIKSPLLISPIDRSLLASETSRDTLIIRYKPVSETYYGPHVTVPTQRDLTDAMNKELHVKFSWRSSISAEGYLVELSTSAMFDTVVWATSLFYPSDDSVKDNEGHTITKDTTDTRIISAISHAALLESTLYYWRVKAFTYDITQPLMSNGQHAPLFGAYSDVWKFTILKELSPSIVEIDDPNIDLATQEDDEPFVVESIFPEYEYSNVGINLKAIYITIDGLIKDPKVFKPNRWIISGRHVSNDMFLDTYGTDTTLFSNTTKINHGQLNGTWTVVIDENNSKSVVVFHPNKL